NCQTRCSAARSRLAPQVPPNTCAKTLAKTLARTLARTQMGRYSLMRRYVQAGAALFQCEYSYEDQSI
ncbi:MAG: hypothetical protein ACI8R4_000516, partial [Paracoccaceae bacterium]